MAFSEVALRANESAVANAGSLDERIFQIMDHIEYRQIMSPEDFESISELRSRAFDAHTVYDHKLNGNAVDESDRQPGVQVFGMYYENQLVSTIRLAKVSKEAPNSQSVRLFSDKLKPLVDQDMTFIDPSRFAVDEEVSRQLPGITLLTLRVAFMATVYHQADACLALVKEEHAAFYRRVFRSTALAGPRKFEGFAIPLVLFASPLANRADICRRYPLFNSTAAERRMLFETQVGRMPPLTVLPTARYADRAA